MRYKQENIFNALNNMRGAIEKRPAEQMQLVGGTDVDRCASVKTVNAPIEYYVTRLPKNCYDCPCYQCWERKDGRIIKCRISGNFALAEVEGKKERRHDCPLKEVKK